MALAATLQSELQNDPLVWGYANCSPGTTLATLLDVARGRSGPINVSVKGLVGFMIGQGTWASVELLARDAKTGVTAHDNALFAAINLVRLANSFLDGHLSMSFAAVNAAMTSAFTALVTFGTLTSGQVNAIAALAVGPLNRATELGIGDVQVSDVIAAKIALGQSLTATGSPPAAVGAAPSPVLPL